MVGRRGFLGALAAMLPLASAFRPARRYWRIRYSCNAKLDFGRGGYVPKWDPPVQWHVSDDLLRSTAVSITEVVNEGFMRW